MSKHSIVLDDASVRAILEGRKTEHRLRIKRPATTCPECWDVAVPHNQDALSPRDSAPSAASQMLGSVPYLRVKACEEYRLTGRRFRSPYVKGDLVSVREAFAVTSPGGETLYRATNSAPEELELAWRVGSHMPSARSRLTLLMTRIRIERVQDIDPDTAVREGFPELTDEQRCGCEVCRRSLTLCTADAGEQIRPFYYAWDRRYGQASWERNDWVWVLSFTKETR